MAHRKAGGTARNLRDSKPKYLGVKIADGQNASAGAIIVRQRGTRFLAGNNTDMGKDHTIHALKAGVVKIGDKRKTGFNNKAKMHKVISVVTK
ncbi:MAG: 50S ribosomal protein L27 [Bacteroidetes bacterium]|nr:50S ribosomal protein L27 [Bacteroidota bacterium]